MTTITTCLLSGGLDSSTALLHYKQWPLEPGESLDALHIQYGQRHHREVNAARDVARALDVPLEIVSAPLSQLARHSALTNRTRGVPVDRTMSEMAAPGPITYVPMRNTNLLALATAWVESRVLDTIERGEEVKEATLLVGANYDDHGGYPDCRPRFYNTFEKLVRRGSMMCTRFGVHFRVVRPLINMTKIEIARMAITYGLDVDLTWSCYLGGEEPCAQCDACQLRDRALTEARGC